MSTEDEIKITLAGKEKTIAGLSDRGDGITENETDTVLQASELKSSIEGLNLEDSPKKKSQATLPKASVSEKITSGYKLKSISDGNTIKMTASSEQSSPCVTTKEPQTSPSVASPNLKKLPPQKSESMEQIRPLDATKPKELASASETIVKLQISPTVPSRLKDQLPDPSKELENKSKSPPVTRKPVANKRVKIHFIPVGSAPQMKQNRFQISGNEQFSTLQEKLRKMLKLTSSQLFLYINESFVPSPDDLIADLDDLFSVRGAKGELELKVSYSLQEAWG